VDWGLRKQAAVDWARQYTFNLVRGINNTDRKYLQSAVSSYFEQGQTRQELEDRIGRIYSPNRASMIAVTEVTRAASEGERAIAKELESQGIRMIPIWQTNNDELVCPLCGPKHGQEIKDGIYPPLHVNCRCFTNHELPKVEK